MSWILLDSSAIYAAAYGSGTLYIIFQGRDVAYEFPNVPFSVFSGLINSDSPGTYYNEHIRPVYGLNLKAKPRKRR